jgi:hypothetical protein
MNPRPRPFDLLYRGVAGFNFRHFRNGGNEDLNVILTAATGAPSFSSPLARPCPCGSVDELLAGDAAPTGGEAGVRFNSGA